ncbi:MBL fold metallo-hydrolase [Ferribacterium limneticum]|uniref:MBL fold metallo-hydrolase n=1 Tax=Ferribacterium limneticum TaxID=76259 RepID=UPI001CFB658E|nr:MBL fold metallo-hydrolase [Ferribacterium limneticum]UCV29053.1 MBL fold metallo-hydrolase [Ferribacterium limneticum]UCV32971.1 MBL fold metallo-hydrolase [Ferribacterium limneticum]
MYPFKHLRTQWPVGHGFFHTAKIDIGNDSYRYVFDCGADEEKDILQQVKCYLAEEESKNIEMLVVSHFHADHVNGIPRLIAGSTVKKLVIPHLPKDFLLVALAKLASQGVQIWEQYSGLLLAPQTWVNALEGGREVEVVRIAATDDENEQDAPPPDGNGIALGRGTASHTRPYDVFFQGKPLWRFKFYVRHSASLATAITNKISGQFNLSPDELQASLRDAAWIKKNWATLERCFKSLGSGRQNATSLCLYSGPSAPHWAALYALSYAPCRCINRYRECCKLGWLGTGDARLKSHKKFQAFKAHYGHLLHSVATLSIPHHGSELDYNPGLAMIGCRHVITSDQYPDPHGKHPHPDVVADLKLTSCAVDFVTRDPASRLNEHFEGDL